MSDMKLSELVYDRLHILGFDSVNERVARYAAEKAENAVKAEINRDVIPDGLKNVLLDMAVGFYLKDAKGFGFIDTAKLNLSETPAKSITEGDVSVTFFGASEGCLTPEARFDRMVESLIHPDERLFSAYRRITW